MVDPFSSDAISIDHYAVLGLPSGTAGSTLTPKDIEKAYKLKARELHPDKRRDDPDATAEFQRLISSYELLKDTDARRAFDTLLRARHERVVRESRLDSKRRKMAADLEERERAAGAGDGGGAEERARREEAEASARLKVELARIRAMMRARREGGGCDEVAEERKKRGGAVESDGGGGGGGGMGLDKEKILKVSWDKEGGDYKAQRLTELFGKFGKVEDVVIRTKGSKKKGTALVVMDSKEAVVAAIQNMCGCLSNPLLVLPLQPVDANLPSTSPATPSEPTTSNLNNILGAGYQAYEDSVLKKLQQAAERQNDNQRR